MHGISLGSTFLITAEVDSMGGIVDGGVINGTTPSPRRTEIEKAQAELRLEYDVREARRRELEFLENGGDPLDFRFGHAASVSVQSTSHTDQDPDRNFTSEAKGSIALTASPQGDSVESSRCLWVTTACEPDSADNFDVKNEILQRDRKLLRPGRCSVTPLEGSLQFDGCPSVKDFEDSPIFYPKKDQAYRRRFRSRTNRDGSRSSSADMVPRGGHDSSVAACPVMLSKPVASENQFETELDGTCAMPLFTPRVTEFAEGNLNLSNSKEKLRELKNMCLKGYEAPVAMKMIESTTVAVVGRDSIGTVGVECPPSSGVEITEDNATSAQLNETNMINEDNKCTSTDDLIKNALVVIKGLDSESSCTRTNFTVDGNRNTDSDMCTDLKNVDSNRACKEPRLPVGENTISRDEKLAIEEHITDAMETGSSIKDDNSSTSLEGNGVTEDHAEADRGKSSLQDTVKGLSNVEEIKSETETGDCVPKMDSFCPARPPVDNASSESKRNVFSGPSPVVEFQPSTANQPKTLDKAQEDRILVEARTIEAKRQKIAGLPKLLLQREPQQKCHWDLVLEEMAWLANDFAQERVWKMTVAAQICRRIAFASRIRLKEQSKMFKQKSVAHTLAKAVMEFWHSARLSVDNAYSSLLEKCKHEALSVVHEMDKTSQDVLQSTTRKQGHDVYEYAVRFLQSNCPPKPFVEVEVPPFVPCDVDLPDVSWQHQFTEENLFYAVPPGAMEMYRNSVESHLAQFERIAINIQEEVDRSGHDAAAECGYEDNGYEEDEGDNLYHLHGTSNTSKLSKNKQKNMKAYAARSYEFGDDLGYGNFADTRNGIPQLKLMGKRPTNSLHVDPIPTKRIRTRRVVSPFGAGPAGFPPVLSRADASSGDTNSLQDDHGSVVPRGSEVDSAMDFDNHSTFVSAEMSAKPKKKKKIKHQSVSFDQRWQLDSSMQNEQNDLVRKRMENNQLESNGNGGSFGQHAKKPKLAKHSLDNSFDNNTPMNGPVASPVASQMSNMSSQTKIIKFIGGRDRGKKGKGLKVSNGQLGPGSPWTIVEDQALVVLVHDMGPNWELVSDAMNNILQFKCIFRKPQECKERHKFLMDIPSGDGADSAEDSGSSQPYPSQLPGIPKGSARQLFRSLHAHAEEDNIKSRFEKIICIEQQLHFRKKKNDNQDLKQLVPIHGSHILALSQVTPNNVNGVLTPLDLCDASTSNQDTLPGGLPPANQGNSPLMHLPGGLNSSLQGSPSMGISNNLASPPSQFSSPRDARYSIPRSGSLPIKEQQRLHQYNPMLPGRNIQASILSSSGSPSGSDRGVRMHPGGNGVSMMRGINRSIPMARPGIQGIPSPVVNSNSEHQRQIIMPEVEIQKTQTNSTVVPPLGGLGTGFSNHHPLVLGSPHPHLSTSNHAITPEQQHAYLRHQLQKQRLLQQQLQKNPSSIALVPHVQTQSQMSTSVQNTSQLQSPSTSQQQKNLQGHGRNVQNGPGGTISLGGKQRQQQYQQSGRQHPQQRQLSESQQVKVVKGNGRGNMLMNQNLPIDASRLNGLSANTANQVSESNIQPQKPYANRGPATPKPVQQISSHLEGGNQGHPSSSVVHSRNHQQLQGQTAENTVNQYKHALRRTGQQNRLVNSDSLSKSQVEQSQEKHQFSSVGTPPVRVNSASNALHKIRVPVCDSAMTSVSSTSGPINSEAIKNSVGNEPSSSGNNLVSHGQESQWQELDTQLQSPPLQPILLQKQSQQLEQPSQGFLQSQSRTEIQGGQNIGVQKDQ